MLELLTEHIIHEILKAVGAGRHAIIYSGGGGFGLLLPNRNIIIGDKELSIMEIIEEYNDVLNRWSLKEFSGRFFIAIDVYPFSPDALTSKEKFQSLRQTQVDNLDRLKRRKFINQLDDLFKPKMPEQLKVQTECQITRRDDLDDDQMRDIGVKFGEIMSEKNKHEDGRVWVSESCFHQFKIGDRLIDANSVNRYTVFVDRNEKKNYGTLVLPGANGKDVFYKVDKEPDEGAECFWRINVWQNNPVFLYANYVRKHGELSLYAQKKERESLNKDGQHSPESDHTATFYGLASSSCGSDLIGALRMDVDDMGALFVGVGTLIELSVKSRMLNLFFKVYLKQICKTNMGKLKSGEEISPTDIIGKNYTDKNASKENKGRNLSVIYAGGDDLFILGAWDETTELAFDIQRCFSLFTGGIFDTEKKSVAGGLGISGGLTLHQPKFPLYQMARKSGEAEYVAKNESGQFIKNGLKNRIALFYADHLTEIERNGKMEKVNENDERLMLSIDWIQFYTVKEIVKFFSLYKSDNEITCMNMMYLPSSVTNTLIDITHVWHEKGRLYIPHFLWFLKKHAREFDEKLNGLQFIKQHFKLTNFNILHLPLLWIELLKRRG